MMKNILKHKLSLFLIIASFAMSACQTQNTGSSDALQVAPPSGLHYSTPDALYTPGVPIQVNTPIVTNSVTEYSIVPSLPAGLSFNTKTGEITGTPTSKQKRTVYMIIASNDSGESKTSLTITIHDFPPAQLRYTTSQSVYIFGMEITPNRPTYTGSADHFSIEPSLPLGLNIDAATGVISGIPKEILNYDQYVILASNEFGLTKTSINLLIVKSGPPANLSYENSDVQYNFGTKISLNKPICYGFVKQFTVEPALPEGLLLNEKTGIISGIPRVKQDKGKYSITASNSLGSTTTTIEIAVAVDPALELEYVSTNSIFLKLVPVNKNKPKHSGIFNNFSVYPELPAGLTINPESGIISGTPIINQNSAEYLVTAFNGDIEKTTSIFISVISSAPSGNGMLLSYLYYLSGDMVCNVAKAIVDNTPFVGGPVAQFSVEPELPAGLTLDHATGIISGTPEEIQGNTEYTITALNSYSSVTTQINIQVKAQLLADLFYSNENAVYVADFLIQNNVPSVTGNTDSYKVEPQLPDGLEIDAATGVIYGTPVALLDETQFTITATNELGSTQKTIKIRVRPLMLHNPAYAVQDAVYSIGMKVVNEPLNVGDATYFSVDPELPDGMHIDATTGVILGIPSAVQAKTEYTVTAENDLLDKETTKISIEILLGLKYNSIDAVYTRNVKISQNTPIVKVTGDPVTYSIDPILPTGLVINPGTGAITGTPSVAQEKTDYTVTSTTNSLTAQCVISIRVLDALVGDCFETACLANGLVTGNVYITDATQLTEPVDLRYIGGSLIIAGTSTLTHVDFLSNLIQVLGAVTIDQNASLENINGLRNIASIRNGFFINANKALTGIPEFKSLTQVRGDLRIIDNDSLVSINGFKYIQAIVGSLEISNNDNLLINSNTDSDFISLFYIALDLKIVSNNQIENLWEIANQYGTLAVYNDVLIIYNENLSNSEIGSFINGVSEYVNVTINNNKE